jgi:hypothetical protein
MKERVFFLTGNDYCVRIVQFDTFKNLNCPGQKCSKYTWTSPAGKACRKTDYLLVVSLFEGLKNYDDSVDV